METDGYENVVLINAKIKKEKKKEKYDQMFQKVFISLHS